MIFVYRTSVVGPSGTPLSDYEEGAIIKLNEGGSPVEFYVSKHDYESGLNGAGRTLAVRKDVYDNRAWDSGNVNAYSGSDLDTWFNGTYKNLLDPAIQTAIGTTKFYYTPGNGNNTVGTLERAVFVLSATELVGARYGVNTEGSQLPNSSLFFGVQQWTRSPIISTTNNVQMITSDTSVSGGIPTSNAYSRPCFTLPSSLLFNPDTNEVVA